MGGTGHLASFAPGGRKPPHPAFSCSQESFQGLCPSEFFNRSWAGCWCMVCVWGVRPKVSSGNAGPGARPPPPSAAGSWETPPAGVSHPPQSNLSAIRSYEACRFSFPVNCPLSTRSRSAPAPRRLSSQPRRAPGSRPAPSARHLEVGRRWAVSPAWQFCRAGEWLAVGDTLFPHV